MNNLLAHDCNHHMYGKAGEVYADEFTNLNAADDIATFSAYMETFRNQ
jgi:hypothetical protein